MQDLAQHILDIAENSVRAGANRVEVRLAAGTAVDCLRLEIVDNGRGMDEQMRQSVLSPFTTSRTERKVGLGLSLLAQAVREAEGDCRVESTPGSGTRVVATFRDSHIDRKPLGDLEETLLTLAVGYPEVDFVFAFERDGDLRALDTREIRASLDGAPMSSPAGIKALGTRIAEVLSTPSDRAGDTVIPDGKGA